MIASYRALKRIGRLLGESLCAAGTELAATNREWLIRQGQLAFLDAMVERPDLIITTDDATSELLNKYGDGGKWRGPMVRQLAKLGLIVADGTTRSCRAARHAGLLTRWRGLDRDSINAERERLRAWLASNPPMQKPPPPKDEGQQAVAPAAAPQRTLFE